MTTHRASEPVAGSVRLADRAAALGLGLALLAGIGWITGMICTVLERPFQERPRAPDRQSRSATLPLTSCEPAPRCPRAAVPCRLAGAEVSGGGTGRHLGRAGARTAPYSGRTVAKRLLVRSCAEWKVFLASSV